MVLMTLIARVADGLPLAASIQDEEQVHYFLKLTLIQLILISFNFFNTCYLRIMLANLIQSNHQ